MMLQDFLIHQKIQGTLLLPYAFVRKQWLELYWADDTDTVGLA